MTQPLLRHWKMVDGVWRRVLQATSTTDIGGTDPITPPPVAPKRGKVTSVRTRSDGTGGGGTVGGGTVVTPPRYGDGWIPLPDVPTVSYQSLYVTGNTLRDVLAKVPPYRLVTLPAGFDEEFDGFPMASGKYGLYYPNIIGFGGAGPTQSRIRLTRMSATPTQNPSVGETMMRLMGGSAALPYAPQNYGWALEGTSQQMWTHVQGNETRPMNFAGFTNYKPKPVNGGAYGSIWQELKISGSAGNANSPPGETFQMNDFVGVRSVYQGIEVSGYNVDGFRCGGSPLGFNNSTDGLVIDCNFHDSYVSGLTASFAGTENNIGDITSGWHTIRVTLARNANNATGSGKRFTGINHENVGGKVVHEFPNISFDNATLYWDQTHIAINNHLFDNPDIHVIEPTWQALHPKWNGCFVVGTAQTYAKTPNVQTSPPEVVKNGRSLTPVHYYAQPATKINDNPLTSFVVLHQ